MSVTRAYDTLRDTVSGPVRRRESLARHTTYRIGGPATLYVECDTLSDVARTIETLAEESIEWVVLGKGSNVLVADGGYDGAVIVLGRDFKRHGVDGETLRAGAGVILAAALRDTYSRGLTGLEFAAGIPGTVGGALAMNAGSRDEWIGSRVETITLWVPGAGLTVVHGHEVEWGYRESDIAQRGLALECTLRLAEDDVERVRRTIDTRLRMRRTSQPVGTANAGSVFKNPPGDSAARLIEACGLKGMRKGGAEVSRVHSNFIVNTGGATAADVLGLVEDVREAVMGRYGVRLEPEIRLLGTG